MSEKMKSTLFNSKMEPAINPPEEIKILDRRELNRIASDLHSLADQFERGTGGNLYDNPIVELKGMKDEISALPTKLLPIIDDAIRWRTKDETYII